jgi:pimeloyl-ACP methyl ester carboxylesterase
MFFKSTLFGSVLAVVSIQSLSQCEDALPRRVQIGTQVQPVSEETRQRLGLRNLRGVEVVSVLPDSTASQTGVQKGDVILGVDGVNVANPTSFVETVSAIRTGKEIQIRLNREGNELSLKCNPKELPRESSAELDIEYASVPSKSGRMRTVLSMPRDKSMLPTFVLLSGLGNGPAEHPLMDPLGMKGIAYGLNKAGFGVLRVDKPGCGDSEGGPAKDADFESVVDGYVAAVRDLKKNPRVDATQVYLLGASMGGVQAPLVAKQEPVGGIVVFGAMSCNWPEYLQSTTRRQMYLSGAGVGQIEQEVVLQSAGWHYLGYEKMAPDDISERHPELIGWVERNWADGKYFSGIHYKFFQQLCKTNVAEAWDAFDGPVLSLWGDGDIVTSAEDHEFLAKVANRKQQGKGEFKKLSGVEHNLRRVPSGEPATDILVGVVDEWAKRVLKAKPSQSVTPE